MANDLQICIISKTYLGILLKNQLIFNDQALKIYTLDDKRLVIMEVIISLIKTKDLLKIYVFAFNVQKRQYFPVLLNVK